MGGLGSGRIRKFTQGGAMQGAAGATYQVLVDVEMTAMEGVPFCGGVADIYEFVDQLLRQLVYKVVELAGMPTHVLGAYRWFWE